MTVRFDLKKRLGAGQFGEVWLASETGLDVERALKIIPPAKIINPKNLFHEAQILKAAEHPNIVRVEDTGYLPDGRIYISMEVLKGSLEDETQGSYVDLTKARKIMIDVLRGLEHSHSKGIIHRDIKPGNILIGNVGEGKLSDFGLAVPKGLSFKTQGVKEYAYVYHIAPEILLGGNFSERSDVYACGVTFYRLINGDNYLQYWDPLNLKKQIVEGKFPNRKRYRYFVTRPIRQIVNKAMNIDPKERYGSALEMRRALEKIEIQMNWKENALENGVRWVCGWDGKCYEIILIQNNERSFDVKVSKGKSRHQLRKLSELSKKNLARKDAERLSRDLLQKFVMGEL